MKTPREVAKQADTFLEAIYDDICQKGCVNKPPGLYCTMCRLFYDKAHVLRWVLDLEEHP